MRLDDMDFLQLIPNFMKEDGAVKGLSKGVDKLTEELAAKIKLFTTWNQIDNMRDDELDYLADELHISWYKKAEAIDIKRQIIKDSFIVHSKLGTAWAVENVVSTYFGEGEVIEWYKYGGVPGHFKIQTVNQSVMNEKYEEFLSVLNAVKRKSAHLDAIELISDGLCKINVFIGSVETEICTYKVNR